MMFVLILAAAALSGAEIVSEADRLPQPDGLSGITRVDDSNYLAVDDSAGRMFSVRVDVDCTTGEIGKLVVTNEVRLAGVIDGEGVAYDPLRKTVWVADEKGSRISEHDLMTGGRLAEVKMPPYVARARVGIGIESLAISPDGLTMWTATEEAVEGDGGKATKSSGTVVRLQRFSRTSGGDAWQASGQFPYAVDPQGGVSICRGARSGLSDLCVLPTGELLALEREFSVKGIFPSFRLRIYRVGLYGATDVSGLGALDGKRFKTAGKKLLLDADTGFAMYEGLCAGPKLADGSQTLLLISDGDDEAVEKLMSVKLVRDKAR